MFAVGKTYDVAIDCLHIGWDSISWVTRLKYLGMFFNAGHKLECDIDYSVCKFYTATNTIYSRSKFTSEISQLFLLETFCLSLISYGCQCVIYDSKKLCQLNVCWNNVYRSLWDACMGIYEGTAVFM